MPARVVDPWRLKPGYLSNGRSDFESVQVLLGRFLADRTSSDPLSDASLLAENPSFRWGAGSPLEKVVHSQNELDQLLCRPLLSRNAIAIVEPWQHVGFNNLGEDVRASLNVAFLAQKIADCDSYLLPLWSSGPFELDQLVPFVSASLAVVVEGGDPTVRDASTFDGGRCPLADLQAFVERLLLARSPTSAFALFICLGHQLAAQAHVALIRQAVAEVRTHASLPRDPAGGALRLLRLACERIEALGSALEIRKGGVVVARGWDHPEFAVAANELSEIGDCQLERYKTPAEGGAVPSELIAAHEVTAHEHEGVIDTTLMYERQVSIAMFHSDEVNEEAMLFANWAYRVLHDALVPVRHVVAGSPLAWLIQLPDALEILCTTHIEGQIATECSATSIIYKDLETRRVRRSFSCQFHPELLSDLRTVGYRLEPTYAELKRDDGARLFARLLYEGMQE